MNDLEVMREAWTEAAVWSGRQGVAYARTLYHVSKAGILEATGAAVLPYGYFVEELLPNFMAEYPECSIAAYEQRARNPGPNGGGLTAKTD